ncbi:MAG: carboxyl transferase domain-containing protein [Thermodesulfobacteriota bacterium]|nr:carboxyl transferase domain-containing protein [Thermodesulfobacteriota bacterium]
MGQETATSILYAKEIAKAENPQEIRGKCLQEYNDIWITPYMAAERGYIDDFIEPEASRAILISFLDSLENKVDEKPWKNTGSSSCNQVLCTGVCATARYYLITLMKRCV